MENASKALIIAASVLIALVLIVMAVSIVRSTQDTQDSVKTTMDATEIATFNNKFTAYCGTNKSAAQVKALANVVVSNNATDSSKTVKMKFTTTTTTTIITDLAPDIIKRASELGGKTYNVTPEVFTNGLISLITIEEYTTP